MKRLFASLALLAVSLAVAAEEPAPAKPDEAAAKSESKESMKARMLEDAKRKAAEAAKAPASTAAAKKEKESKLPSALTKAPETPPAPAPEKSAEKKAAATTANTKAAAQPAAVLPKVEVKKARITVLDVQLAQQQKEIAREQKLTKPTELDKALNDSKVAQKLSILGGQSADYRAGIAKERVSMMQEESDLIEAIAHAKTKEEKAELQKQLEELKAYRRDLEKARR